MPKTNAAIGNYLSLLFNNIGWPNVGDVTGLLPSGTSGNFYISLHTGYPGVAGDQTTNEAAYGSYARIAVVRSVLGWTVSAPQVINVSTLLFPQCTSGTETEVYWGLGTAASGAGNLLYFGPIGDKVVVFTAETTDNITVPDQAFSVDDRVGFFPGTADDTFPTGLTIGTVYFVKSASGDVITVAATSGGTTIDITAAGSGTCAKIHPFAVTTGVTPSIISSTLVIKEN